MRLKRKRPGAARRPSDLPLDTRFLRRLRRLFWDAPLQAADLRRRPEWVAARVLEYGDGEDVRRLRQRWGTAAFLDVVRRARLTSPKTATFWRHILKRDGTAMFADVLPLHGRKCLDQLAAIQAPALKGWTLAGGTGLALQLRHRRSEDFDFFRRTPFRVEDLYAVFRACGHYETLQEARDTLTGLLWRTKLSFFRVPAPGHALQQLLLLYN